MDFLSMEKIMQLLPVITGIFGVGTGVLFVIPMLFKLVKKYREALEELTRFIRLHKAFFMSNEVQGDFRRVIKLWDNATEYTAKICKRLRLKKTADFFRSVVKDTWYIQ